MKAKKKNSDIDESNEGVSYEKGLEFEKEFATFLRDELKWDKVRVGAHMTGKNNAKGTSIDVFGERLDYVGVKYMKMFNRWMLASGFMAILSFIWFVQSWGSDGVWFLIFSLASLISAIAFRLMSDANHKQNAWVECKNLKSKATVPHIHKTIMEFNDYRASGNTDNKFTHHYFASANGYVENALKLATDNGIMCYVKIGDSFEQVNYWDEKKKQN